MNGKSIVFSAIVILILLGAAYFMLQSIQQSTSSAINGAEIRADSAILGVGL